MLAWMKIDFMASPTLKPDCNRAHKHLIPPLQSAIMRAYPKRDEHTVRPASLCHLSWESSGVANEPCHSCACRWDGVSGRCNRGFRQQCRRGGVQYRHDRLSGNSHRPFLLQGDRHADLDRKSVV